MYVHNHAYSFIAKNSLHIGTREQHCMIKSQIKKVALLMSNVHSYPAASLYAATTMLARVVFHIICVLTGCWLGMVLRIRYMPVLSPLAR